VNVVILFPFSASKHSQNITNNGKNTFLMKETKYFTFLEFYTWFPYQSPDLCSRVQNVVLLDKWILRGDNGFVKNSSIFPQKITRNLNKCPMRISARVTPLLLVNEPVEENVSGTRKIVFNDGWEIYLAKILTKTLNMTEEYLSPSKDHDTLYNADVSATHYTTTLINNIADIAFGAIDIKETAEGTEMTRPYHWDYWSWYVPCAVPYPRWKGIFMVFSDGLWSAFSFSVFIVTFLMVIIARNEPLNSLELHYFINPLSSFFTVI
jgi:hypothetical protein